MSRAILRPLESLATARAKRRAAAEERSWSPPGDLKTNIELLLSAPASSGVPVTENTALGVAAVVSCVSLLADMVAKLPIYLYQPTDKGPQEITNHPAIRLFSGRPCDLHSSFELRQLMMIGIGLGGNGYAKVFRSSDFRPMGLEWLAPCDVVPRMVRRPDRGSFIAYSVRSYPEDMTRQDILHVRGFCTDGIMGRSPIWMLRESIGTSVAQTQAAGSLIRNGAKFPGFLQSDTILKKEVIEDARQEFNANYTGSLNAGRIPILNGVFKFQQTQGMSMSDAQFVESRKLELHEIARHYRIPAFMIDSTSTSTWGTGIEQQTLGFLNFCLDPYLVAWEQSMAFTLLTDEEIAKGIYFQFDRDRLANVALEARTNFFTAMRNIGAFCPNDVLAELGYPLISREDGGFDYGKPFNASGGTPHDTPQPKPSNP